MLKRLGIAAALAIGFFILTLVASVLLLSLIEGDDDTHTSVVSGDAMSPTLRDGETVTFRTGVLPERLDIVVYRYPSDPSVVYVGRVIGLPSEEVTTQAGSVWVNGAPLEEPYLAEPIRYQTAALVLSSDEYWILGDNRNNSSDSHVFGAVPADNIIGLAVDAAGSTATPR